MAAGCACWGPGIPGSRATSPVGIPALERLPADRRRCRRRFFAINGGGLGADAGALYYRAPDTLEWEPLELSYTDFLRWALGGGLEEFYEGLRWPGWQTDAQALAGDQGFSFYPFLWTREGSPSTSSRKAVDVAELYAMNVEQAGA
ncbi:DUF2625 family protein [Achromobacter xylosoxidans]